MRSEPRWLDLDKIIDTNRAEVEATGEPFFLRDEGLLEAACMRPRNLWHYEAEDDVVRLAAEYALVIARCHAFLQGNKRTGLTSSVMFIEINGFRWVAADTDDVGKHLNNAVKREISDGRFVEKMRPFVVPAVPVWEQ